MSATTKTSSKACGRRMARTSTNSGGGTDQEGANQPVAEVAQPIAAVSASLKKPTKNDLILGLLQRKEGATLDQMIEVTGWLGHTTRAALTGLKKKGHVVTSEKLDGVRTYRVAASGKA